MRWCAISLSSRRPEKQQPDTRSLAAVLLAAVLPFVMCLVASFPLFPQHTWRIRCLLDCGTRRALCGAVYCNTWNRLGALCRGKEEEEPMIRKTGADCFLQIQAHAHVRCESDMPIVHVCAWRG